MSINIGLPPVSVIVTTILSQNRKVNKKGREKSRPFYKFLLAFWAGNFDFSLALGHSYRLVAAGAVKIPMVPVLQLLHKLQIFPVFPIPLVNVPGEHPENGPAHQNIGKKSQRQIHQWQPDKHHHHTANNAAGQNGHIQLIRAVSAQHKMAKSGLEPGNNSVHRYPPLKFLFVLYVAGKIFATPAGENLRIIQIRLFRFLVFHRGVKWQKFVYFQRFFLSKGW